MKIKTIAKVSILAIVAGFIFTGIGYAFNKNTFLENTQMDKSSATSSEKYEYENESISLEAFRNINIVSDLNNIEIIPADKYKLDLKYKKEYVNIEYKIENETLIIREKKVKNEAYNLEDYKNNKGNGVKIYIPKNTQINNLSIASNISNLYLNEISINKLDLSCDTGNININNCKSSQSNILTATGSIDVKNLDGLSAKFESNMGNINIVNSSIKETLELSNNLGHTKFQGELLGNINVSNNLGNIELDINNKQKEYNYNLQTDSGKIIINDETKNKKFIKDNNSKFNINLECNSGNINLKIK